MTHPNCSGDNKPLGSPLVLFPSPFLFIYLHILSKFRRRLKMWRVFDRKCISPALKNALTTCTTRRMKTFRRTFLFYIQPSQASSCCWLCCLQYKGTHHGKGWQSNRSFWLRAEERRWASLTRKQIWKAFSICPITLAQQWRHWRPYVASLWKHCWQGNAALETTP